jgi:DnaJ homolog subfamily C member 7
MKIDSSNCDAIYVRGLSLYYSDNLEKGIMHFERTLVLDPDHKKAKLMRTKSRTLKDKKEQGNECFKTGKYREALSIYTDALTIDPINKEINSKLHYNRALVNTKVCINYHIISTSGHSILPKKTKITRIFISL